MIAPLVFAQATAQSGKRGAIQPEAWRLVSLANAARSEQGVGPLGWDPALAEAARQHCLRMAAEGEIAHQYAGEPDISARAKEAGVRFSLIEENVAAGPSPAAIHDAWMHSAGHRANLLNPDVNGIGIAVVASRGTFYAVADYERAVTTLTQAQVEAKVAALLQTGTVAILPDASVARIACAMDHGMPDVKSSPRPTFVMRWQDAELTHLPQALLDRLASGKYRQAAVGSCSPQGQEGSFTAYRVAVLLY
jgi:hypothetical protein